MTKKHFIALADLIRMAKNTENRFSKGQIDLLAELCEFYNRDFKESRWLAYINGECVKNGGKINGN